MEGEPQTEKHSAGVIAPPPLIYLAALGIGFALEGLLPGSDPPGWVVPVGIVLIVAGLALMLSFVRLFAREKTAIDPRGSTKKLVTDGPYRITRNPGYLGMALVFTGIALTAQALWVLAALPLAVAVINWGVIVREERYLEGLFGEEYLAFKRRTRRWI